MSNKLLCMIWLENCRYRWQRQRSQVGSIVNPLHGIFHCWLVVACVGVSISTWPLTVNLISHNSIMWEILPADDCHPHLLILLTLLFYQWSLQSKPWQFSPCIEIPDLLLAWRCRGWQIKTTQIMDMSHPQGYQSQMWLPMIKSDIFIPKYNREIPMITELSEKISAVMSQW